MGSILLMVDPALVCPIAHQQKSNLFNVLSKGTPTPRAIDQGYIKSCNTILAAHVIIGGINSYVIMQNVPKLPW
jgi:hypothetical protein